MKYYQIVFSPTGETERVAKAITQNWPQVGTIDLSAPDTKYADICLESDALGVIAMPSFIGALSQFLQLQLDDTPDEVKYSYLFWVSSNSSPYHFFSEVLDSFPFASYQHICKIWICTITPFKILFVICCSAIYSFIIFPSNFIQRVNLTRTGI